VSRPLSAEFSLLLGFRFSTRLGKNLQILRDATLKQNFDACIIVDGKEGSGKSVLAQQVAAFMDVEHKIELSQVCFRKDDVMKLALSLPKGKAIVYDEARGGLNRRRSMDDVNIELTDMLAEIRQRNLFFIFVMPSFYDMDMNVAVWRTRCLIHVFYDWNIESSEPLVRGSFRFYSEEGKKQLYCNKYYRQSYAYPFLNDNSFDDRFGDHYVVDKEEYIKKKAEAARYYIQKDPYKCSECGLKALNAREDGTLRCRLGHVWSIETRADQ
jgi:hypothetical protein